MTLLLPLCLLYGSLSVVVAQLSSDGFDDDLFEFERGSTSRSNVGKPLFNQKAATPSFRPPSPETYYPEVFFLILLVAYAINFWRGRKVNDAIVLEWAGQFCQAGTLLDRNFALVGPGYTDDGEELVMKNSHSEFQLWASGRRFCQGMLITLHLRCRHDLLTLASYAITPSEDHLIIEVSMQPSAMPPTVLAVAPAKQLRALQKSCRDLAIFAHPLVPTAAGLRKWPDALQAVAESSVVFADLFPASIMSSVFGSAVFQEHGRHFRWLHFSSEYSREEGAVRKPVLRLCYAIPKHGRMAELDRLMEAAMLLVDIVGSYEMPAKCKEKADHARAEFAKLQEKERRKELEEAVQKRKLERKEAEMEKVKKMTPAQRQKYEDRQKRVEMGRALKKRSVRA